MVCDDPQGYEIEFFDQDGQTLCLVSLSEEQALEWLAPDFESVKKKMFERHGEVFRRLSGK